MTEQPRFTLTGATADWEIVVGLELHAQVISQSKLFSRAATMFGAAPNQHVALFDAALPGQLPTINATCVRQAVRTGLALKAKINKTSIFARKNYFYADLPQGYQISQFDQPIIGIGFVPITIKTGKTSYEKIIGLERIHLEQDAGKSLHDIDPKKSYIDLNRAGIALMEIVSKPDITSPDEAESYVKTLRKLLRHIETCDGNMQAGSLRADVNVSVRKKSAKELGTRTELKNLNSIKFMKDAIVVEANRQIALLEQGGKVIQETRLYDPNQNETRPLRDKEDASDYRYFPDPDLLPLILTDEFINSCQTSLPPLPNEIEKNLINQYGLSQTSAEQLLDDKLIYDYFIKGLLVIEKNLTKKEQLPLVVQIFTHWLLGELTALIYKRTDKTAEKSESYFADVGITPLQLATLALALAHNEISGKIAKEIFPDLWQSDKLPKTIMTEKGLSQISNKTELAELAKKVITDNPKQVAEFIAGNEKVFGWLVGQLMKLSRGQAAPALANEILKNMLQQISKK